MNLKDKIQSLKDFSDKLEEIQKIRNVSIKFSLNEIHDLHMALEECIEYHRDNEQHKKQCGNKCDICKAYENLYRRIVRRCNCVDNPRGEINEENG